MLLLALTVVPSLLIILFFVKSDKFPEPLNVIIKVFVWGVLITIPIFFINTYLLYNSKDNYIMFLPAAFVEEGFKFLVFYFVVLKLKDFDEPMDALVYGVTISLGFATLENLYYVYLSEFAEIYGSGYLAALRTISAIPAHASFGCIMGFFFLKYHFDKSSISLFLALIIPILIHFLYNLFVIYGSLINAMFLVLVLVITNLIILSKLKKRQLKGK